VAAAVEIVKGSLNVLEDPGLGTDAVTKWAGRKYWIYSNVGIVGFSEGLSAVKRNLFDVVVGCLMCK